MGRIAPSRLLSGLNATGCARIVFTTFQQRIILLFVWAGSLAARLQGECAEASHAAEPVKAQLYYIPHTHWEGAVFKTREEYLDDGLGNILKAVRLLKEYPEYKFALDQVAYFRPFLERYPEEAAAFRKFIAEGRLEIVGGMDVMPDMVKPSGESIVHQIQYAKGYCRRELGVDVKTAWLLDTFGHHPQEPQILRLGGFDSFWFCRGVPRRDIGSEFLWQGIDATTIPAIWLPGFYGLFYGPPRTQDQFGKWFKDRFDSLATHARGPERVGLAGVDVSAPEEYVTPLVREFNAGPDAPFTIRYSTPREFAAVVARRTGLPVMTNDFNPIFQGTYSSRIELKQTMRDLEYLLLTGEKLQTLAAVAGHPADPAMLWRGWEPVLFNQTHDLASGVMTDHVYEDTVRSYDFSRRVINESIDMSWRTIANQIDTCGEGVPLVVFNPLGWARSDVVETEVSFAERGITQLELWNNAGESIPVQIMSTRKDAHGGIEQARVIFVATDVPAMGWTIFHLRGLKADQAKPKDFSTTTDSNSALPGNAIENEYFRVRFDLNSGAITSLHHKTQDWEALSGPANVVSMQRDKGDLWELYHGLDGGSHVAMTNQEHVPVAEGESVLSTGFAKEPGVIRCGPVVSEFAVKHPLGSADFETRVRLYHTLKRIDVQTALVNHEKYVRYQAIFPIAVRQGRNAQEIPFGAIERPEGVEFAAQHWVDYSDPSRGVALLNRGLPGNMITDSTLMISLLRSHNLGAYGFGGGYEPGMSSETGFELNQRRVLEYALLPHAGGWREAKVYRAGWEYNHPLIVRRAESHGGRLPTRWGLLDISADNVVVTAITPVQSGGFQFRVYEAEGKTTSNARLHLHARVDRPREINLLGDTLRKVSVSSDTLRFDLHPFEIKTIEMKLARPR